MVNSLFMLGGAYNKNKKMSISEPEKLIAPLNTFPLPKEPFCRFSRSIPLFFCCHSEKIYL